MKEESVSVKQGKKALFYLIVQYQTDKIENQYQAFGSVLGVAFDTDAYRREAEQAVGNAQLMLAHDGQSAVAK